MKAKKISFSLVDLMVVIAILMILGATIAPHFAKTRNPSAYDRSLVVGQKMPRAR